MGLTHKNIYQIKNMEDSVLSIIKGEGGDMATSMALSLTFVQKSIEKNFAFFTFTPQMPEYKCFLNYFYNSKKIMQNALEKNYINIKSLPFDFLGNCAVIRDDNVPQFSGAFMKIRLYRDDIVLGFYANQKIIGNCISLEVMRQNEGGKTIGGFPLVSNLFEDLSKLNQDTEESTVSNISLSRC